MLLLRLRRLSGPLLYESRQLPLVALVKLRFLWERCHVSGLHDARGIESS